MTVETRTTHLQPVAEPVDPDGVNAALDRLRDDRFPGISGLARWLFAAAHTDLEPDQADETEGDWCEFQAAFARYAEFDRDQLCIVLGWPTEMDDLEFVDQLHRLRAVQAEHRHLTAPPEPGRREHVARVLAVALHTDCPDDDVRHAAGAHGPEALRLVDALTAAGVHVRTAAR